MTMTAVELYYMGMECMNKKDYMSAIEYFQLSNQIDVHFKTFEKLFQCFSEVSDTENAYRCIENSYTLNPKNDKTTFLYAEFCLKNGKTKLALKLLDEIIERNPSYRKAENLLENIRSRK